MCCQCTSLTRISAVCCPLVTAVHLSVGAGAGASRRCCERLVAQEMKTVNDALSGVFPCHVMEYVSEVMRQSALIMTLRVRQYERLRFGADGRQAAPYQ